MGFSQWKRCRIRVDSFCGKNGVKGQNVCLGWCVVFAHQMTPKERSMAAAVKMAFSVGLCNPF